MPNRPVKIVLIYSPWKLKVFLPRRLSNVVTRTLRGKKKIRSKPTLEAALLLPGPSLGDLGKSCPPGPRISHLHKRHIGLAQRLASFVHNRLHSKCLGFVGPVAVVFNRGQIPAPSSSEHLRLPPSGTERCSKMVARACLGCC